MMLGQMDFHMSKLTKLDNCPHTIYKKYFKMDQRPQKHQIPTRKHKGKFH